MTDEQYNTWGHQAIDVLERRFRLNERYTALSTEQLAAFWQGMTEACLDRLAKLKPELVTDATKPV